MSNHTQKLMLDLFYLLLLDLYPNSLEVINMITVATQTQEEIDKEFATSVIVFVAWCPLMIWIIIKYISNKFL